jgi:hypothetical protein
VRMLRVGMTLARSADALEHRAALARVTAVA